MTKHNHNWQLIATYNIFNKPDMVRMCSRCGIVSQEFMSVGQTKTVYFLLGAGIDDDIISTETEPSCGLTVR